jgi:hypothetical protein
MATETVQSRKAILNMKGGDGGQGLIQDKTNNNV